MRRSGPRRDPKPAAAAEPDVVRADVARRRASAAFLLKQFGPIRPLGPNHTGDRAVGHGRHQLYVGRDVRTRAPVLIKVLSKPGVVYERNLTNEIATLSTINRELPDSRYFPLLSDHGRLPDGRIFLVMSLFDEWPLATTIGPERMPHHLVAHLRTALAVATALGQLHHIGIFHVDLNPMNILYRADQSRPVIRLVDFESAYEVGRHGRGDAYSPPTTPGYCAPEVMEGRVPDARADAFSLGAVLYTLIAGYGWPWETEPSSRIDADTGIDAELKTVLLTAVNRDADKRYQSIAEMSAAVAAYLESIWPGRSWT